MAGARKVAGAVALLALGAGVAFVAGRRSGRDERAPHAASGEPIRGAPIRSSKRSTLPPEVRLMTGDAPPPKTGDARPARVVDGYTELDFEVLTGFDYRWSATSGLPLDDAGNPERRSLSDPHSSSSRIPADVQAWNGKKVFVTGFMQPVDFDGDGVKSFLLTNFPGGCCFGMVPRLNEWIVVSMRAGERAEFVSYEPLTLWGTLEVGENFSGDVVVDLFRMTPDRVVVGEE